MRETNGMCEVTLYRSTNGTLDAQSQSRPNIAYCLGRPLLWLHAFSMVGDRTP